MKLESIAPSIGPWAREPHGDSISIAVAVWVTRHALRHLDSPQIQFAWRFRRQEVRSNSDTSHRSVWKESKLKSCIRVNGDMMSNARSPETSFEE
jgi:hypothetical protein